MTSRFNSLTLLVHMYAIMPAQATSYHLFVFIWCWPLWHCLYWLLSVGSKVSHAIPKVQNGCKKISTIIHITKITLLFMVPKVMVGLLCHDTKWQTFSAPGIFPVHWASVGPKVASLRTLWRLTITVYCTIKTMIESHKSEMFEQHFVCICLL